MDRLLNIGYWFEPLPGSPNLLFWRIMIGIAILSIILAIVAVIFIRRYKKDGVRRRLWVKISTWGFTMGPIFLILAFFRFQNAYFLSMRSIVALWILGTVVWLFFIVKYIVLVLPRRLEKQQEQATFNRYIPRSK